MEEIKMRQREELESRRLAIQLQCQASVKIRILQTDLITL